ncbi:MAG: hypothetical protein WD847_21355 [Pirellulales bacterium]
MTTDASKQYVSNLEELQRDTSVFYRHVFHTLIDESVPFLVGGAYALTTYTGITRRTKDFDIFVLPHDIQRTLSILAKAGYRTELKYEHWIGKVMHAEHVIDLIFNSGNGICPVDQEWFEHAVPDEVLGLPLRLCPAEELIWQKAFIMERDRYDGADVAHLILARGEQLDWPRLLRRFGDHWHVLLAHLVLFTFIYPGEQSRIPRPIMDELLGRLQAQLDRGQAAERLCRGTLLSLLGYLDDVQREGYRDARLIPLGTMTERQVAAWTAAFERP